MLQLIADLRSYLQVRPGRLLPGGLARAQGREDRRMGAHAAAQPAPVRAGASQPRLQQPSQTLASVGLLALAGQVQALVELPRQFPCRLAFLLACRTSASRLCTCRIAASSRQ